MKVFKQECTFFVGTKSIFMEEQWKCWEGKRGGKRGVGNDTHLESMPLNESLSKPKYPMGWWISVSEYWKPLILAYKVISALEVRGPKVQHIERVFK
jgi:hypothetical protein